MVAALGRSFVLGGWILAAAPAAAAAPRLALSVHRERDAPFAHLPVVLRVEVTSRADGPMKVATPDSVLGTVGARLVVAPDRSPEQLVHYRDPEPDWEQTSTTVLEPLRPLVFEVRADPDCRRGLVAGRYRGTVWYRCGPNAGERLEVPVNVYLPAPRPSPLQAALALFLSAVEPLDYGYLGIYPYELLDAAALIRRLAAPQRPIDQYARELVPPAYASALLGRGTAPPDQETRALLARLLMAAVHRPDLYAPERFPPEVLTEVSRPLLRQHQAAPDDIAALERLNYALVREAFPETLGHAMLQLQRMAPDHDYARFARFIFAQRAAEAGDHEEVERILATLWDVLPRPLAEEARWMRITALEALGRAAETRPLLETTQSKHAEAQRKLAVLRG